MVCELLLETGSNPWPTVPFVEELSMIWSATRSRSFHAAAPTPHAPRPMSLAVALAAIVACAASATAQDARQIMGEVQKRADATSQHYEGLLQVINAQGKISDKRWTFDRLGSAGASRSI